MPKRIFLFPGQGAQYTGMGVEFYEEFPESRKVYDLASQVTGLDIPKLCFEEKDKLNITEYTQICMLTTEAAIFMALKERGIQADAAAGLSLGEYGALIACGALDLADAFRVIRKRGIYMQEAVPTGGAMAAVLGLEGEKLEQICRETQGQVFLANYNCPGQLVITGYKEAVASAGKMAVEAGARKVVPLKVSGPFHSPLLLEAGEKLEKELEKVVIQDYQIPYISNVTAEYVRDKETVKPLLKQQVSSPVRWQQSMENLIAEEKARAGEEKPLGAILEFVEIGPGKTLSGFMRRINREAVVFNIDRMEDFKKYVDR